MKKIYLLPLAVLFTSILTFAQNVDDNKVSFAYIQLPLKKLDSSIKTYKTLVNHLYKEANKDSLKMLEIRQKDELLKYQSEYRIWQDKKAVLDKDYFTKMAAYEKAINAGTTATQPLVPVYPASPIYNPTINVQLHTEIADVDFQKSVSLQGFDQAEGGLIVLIDLYPMRSNKIVERKSGSGAGTKYDYNYQYILPVGITVTTPDGTVLLKQILMDELQNEHLKSFSSQYDYLVWKIDNEQGLFKNIEQKARANAFSNVNQLLNDQFGFVKMTRETEIYTVKKYKQYEYSDVTAAYTATAQALALVSKDKNRATAIPKLDQAIAKWKGILEESNLYDEKARVNDKITAMIHCNLAELYEWKGDYNNAELELNLALNSGVFKFKNHSERMKDFYTAQRTRWEIHY
ncbi:MAG: hypothetical protein ACK5FX_03105 [Flavobacteriia bacterium]|jgi:hypothetical protein